MLIILIAGSAIRLIMYGLEFNSNLISLLAIDLANTPELSSFGVRPDYITANSSQMFLLFHIPKSLQFFQL